MAGSGFGFEQVYAAFYPKIYRYLARMLGNCEAEDLTQEVFTRISLALSEFRGESQISTWVYRIATNAALDRQRSPSFRQRKLQVYDLDNGNSSKVIEIPTIEQQMVRNEMNQCIRSLIDSLPDHYRSVLVLSEFEGFKNREIAEILDLSLDVVKIRLHRAREKLKSEMTIHCDLYRDERNELACDIKNV